TQLVRAGTAEVLHEDYIRTARAKGLRELVVLARHALPNALIPAITVLGMEFGILMGGAVVTETIFAWPGMGRLVVQGVIGRDYPVVQAAVFFIAVFVVICNLLAELVCGWVDPRVRAR
ncbi:MAG: peptide ABC transporter permease, partial [Chloroflexota bacterium]